MRKSSSREIATAKDLGAEFNVCHALRLTRDPRGHTVIPKTEQLDFRVHAPRAARKLGVVARDEESRRRNGGHLGSLQGLIAGRETQRP